MSNRAMRRQMARNNRQTLEQMSRDAKKAALIRNGITVKDLEDNYNKGWEEGFSQGTMTTGSVVYAAIGIALHDLFGFGHKRILRTMQAVDKHVCEDISSIDTANELLEKTGIRLNFGEPFDRVEETYASNP